MRARQTIAEAILGKYGYKVHSMAQHVWLELPDPWCTDDFVAHAKMRGVLVSPAEAFVAGRSASPYAVRITLGSVPDRETLERGLTTLAEILDEPPGPAACLV